MAVELSVIVPKCEKYQICPTQLRRHFFVVAVFTLKKYFKILKKNFKNLEKKTKIFLKILRA